MQIAIVGAGPVGTFLSLALARRGHGVILVDRDAGPSPDGSWARKGVMQFLHPHFFRHPVRQALLEELPDVWDRLVAAGGVPALLPGMPEVLTGLACRRSTVERVLSQAVASESGLTRRVGRAESVAVQGDAVVGVVADGELLAADLVISATGRAGRFADELRDPGVGGPTGFSYVSRMYRALPGVTGPSADIPQGALCQGYLTIVFPQDDNTLSTLIVRASDDDELAALTDAAAFDAAARTIPNLAPWTDPTRFVPLTPVMAGGGLENTYRGQQGTPEGMVFVGDAVCTTNPAAGRGISLGLLQARRLLALLDEHDRMSDVAAELDAWCLREIRPWFDDHVRNDAALLRRFRDQEPELDGVLASDLVCAAAAALPALMPMVGPFQGMLAPPAALAPAHDRVRDLWRSGWRPDWADGPSRDELVATVTSALTQGQLSRQ